jgi:hypothetical protein
LSVPEPEAGSKRGIPPSWFVWPGVAAIAVLLLSEHREHALDYLPFLVLLACPLMHVLMHGKHRHDRHS